MIAMCSGTRALDADRAVVYAIHEARAPSDEEWAEYIGHVRDVLRSLPDPSLATSFVVTDGGAPNARQRRLVLSAVQEICGESVLRLRTSVCSDSALVRGVVTAFSWYMPEIRGFAPSQIKSALAHVRARPADVEVITTDLEELARTLRHARTVQRLLEAIRARPTTLGV